jgi:hypothetical protein
MDANTVLDKDSIMTASIEELSEEERQDYLVAKEHYKAQFLKGFMKNRQEAVTRVQDCINNQVEYEVLLFVLEFCNLWP